MSQQPEFTKHAKEMLTERNITEDWVWQTISSPDTQELGLDNNMHYTKVIAEKDNRVLHVVVNPQVEPQRIVTLFFDRRLRSKK